MSDLHPLNSWHFNNYSSDTLSKFVKMDEKLRKHIDTLSSEEYPDDRIKPGIFMLTNEEATDIARDIYELHCLVNKELQ